MSNATVEGFYTKNTSEGYEETYELDHGPRLDALIERYDLKTQLARKRVLDVGGGLGFLGKRLDPSTDYWVLDGAHILERKRLCRGTWHKVDLDHHSFGSEDGDNCLARKEKWDAGFCLETLEHLPGIYNCVEQMKKLVKRDGMIYISVPTETVWHNAIFPSLLWPPANFLQWLGQMALPLADPIQESAYIYEPKGRGWPAYQYRCRNAGWEEARMLFPKGDPKFYGQTPVGYVNL